MYRLIIILGLILGQLNSSSWSQGMIEAGSVYGTSSSLPTGLNHSNLVNKSFNHINNTLNGININSNSSKDKVNSSSNIHVSNINTKTAPVSYSSKKNNQVNDYFKLAQNFEAKQDYDNAIKNYYLFITTRAKLVGNSDPYVITTYLTIGKIYESEDKFLEAKKFVKTGLQLASRKYGPGNYNLKPFVWEIANIDAALNDYKGASSGYEQVYAYEEKKFGVSNICLVKPLILASENYLKLKDYEDADELYIKALNILKANNQDNKLKPNIIEVLNKIIEIRKNHQDLGTVSEYENYLFQLNK